MPEPPNFKRLPGHVVAPLLRALMSIQRTPERRLYLRKATERRAINSPEDYRVFQYRMIGNVRADDHVGNIYLDDRIETTEERMTPWRWSIDTTRGGTNTETGWWAGGRAQTREEAMDAFRNAWDTYQPKKDAG
jgi:hypothetical protein